MRKRIKNYDKSTNVVKLYRYLQQYLLLNTFYSQKYLYFSNITCFSLSNLLGRIIIKVWQIHCLNEHCGVVYKQVYFNVSKKIDFLS